MLRTILIIYMIFLALPSWGSDLQNAINQIFPNQIKVYGVKIIGTGIITAFDWERFDLLHFANHLPNSGVLRISYR